MKRIICACLEQTLKFVTEEDYQTFIKTLDRKRVKYKIVDKQIQSDKTIIAKFIKNQNDYAVGDYLN